MWCVRASGAPDSSRRQPETTHEVSSLTLGCGPAEVAGQRHDKHPKPLKSFTSREEAYYCIILRGTIVNRTYGIHKNLCILPFLLTISGPINYGPP